jgi:hypothetical protein
MAKKAAEKKVKKPTLLEFNKGHKIKELKVGDKVEIYRIPYKQKGLQYSGVVRKVINTGALGAWVVHERSDTKKETIDYIYLGKIYSGWDKPFD